ncbi:MAG: nitrate reductase, partial [Nocardioidaceae bacterium]
WKENGVDFGNPINLVPLAAGIVIAIGNTTLKVSDDFELTGISLGTIVVLVFYHLSRAVAPSHLRDEGAILAVGTPGMYEAEDQPPAHRDNSQDPT